MRTAFNQWENTMMRNFLKSMSAAILFAAMSAGSALAADAAVGNIVVQGPWARASASMAKAGAAFMTIENKGSALDRLVSASADVSDKVELHTHIKEGDVMKMRQVEAIDVPAGGTTELKPGGLHVMFMGLKHPLNEGESFPLTLSFEGAGEVTVDVVVKEAGAMGLGHGHGNMNKGDKM
ncbi:MAG: copper chaperone PCu(A)C [Rhodospirillales bacterium]|nr:copper chaperone PCu(A)C [Rhodospirillales bacterium]